MYGLVQEIPQKETTPFYPRSPYGKNVSTLYKGLTKGLFTFNEKIHPYSDRYFSVYMATRCDVFTHPISVRLLGETDEGPICTEILCTLIHYNIGGNIANNLKFVMYVWTRLNGPFCEATHTDTSLLDLGYYLPVAWFCGMFTLPDTDTDTDKNGFNYNMQNYSHWPTPTQTPILSVSVSVNTPLKSGWVVSLLAGELLLRAVFLVFSYIWRYY